MVLETALGPAAAHQADAAGPAQALVDLGPVSQGLEAAVRERRVSETANDFAKSVQPRTVVGGTEDPLLFYKTGKKGSE